MNFENEHVIISGAGGLGSALAKKLVYYRLNNLVVIDINKKCLDKLKKEIIHEYSGLDRPLKIVTIQADISNEKECEEAIKISIEKLKKIDLLINTAGINNFGLYGEKSNSKIELMTKVNLVAPMIMANCIIPHMKENKSGKIINIGSILGSVGFACFATYSATKFGLRGFSEALRREVKDDGISVIYIAPRAIKTKMNNDKIIAMGNATGMIMDEPEYVVNQILISIVNSTKETFIGFSESILVKINSIFPRLADLILKGNNKIAKKIAIKD